MTSTSTSNAINLAQSAFEAVCKERDEALEELQQWKMLCVDQFIRGQQSRIHEAQEIKLVCERLERERDEARKENEAMRETIGVAYESLNVSTTFGTTPKQDQARAKLQPFLP